MNFYYTRFTILLGGIPHTESRSSEATQRPLYQPGQRTSCCRERGRESAHDYYLRACGCVERKLREVPACIVVAAKGEQQTAARDPCRERAPYVLACLPHTRSERGEREEARLVVLSARRRRRMRGRYRATRVQLGIIFILGIGWILSGSDGAESAGNTTIHPFIAHGENRDATGPREKHPAR